MQCVRHDQSELWKLHCAVTFVCDWSIETCHYRGRELVSDSRCWHQCRLQLCAHYVNLYHMHHCNYAATRDMVECFIIIIIGESPSVLSLLVSFRDPMHQAVSGVWWCGVSESCQIMVYSYTITVLWFRAVNECIARLHCMYTKPLSLFKCGQGLCMKVL